MTTSQEQRDAQFSKELNQQTVAFNEAINEAITEIAHQFKVPLINAISGALVCAEAQLLAGIPDVAARQKLFESMNNMRPAAYAQCGATMNIEVIQMQDDEVLQ